ncbi:hypothetical protein O181_012008 [Austropuccinia psidii MF-1]|uniref:Reverse transcriptase/retrotransposon-derived protein RNase H-like domain-containing protein n=1 Tax=Austropuccinia psidii MF-1 TaxID=1389203 RepID=A0A9Q3BVY8_9BASI|nr:hypothetical protein [Austropuccinia psidii MF-1]
MKISLKKCNFGFEELKASRQIVAVLSLGIDKNKVAEVLLKPIPQNNKEMMSFIGFASYYRKHLKDFAILAKSICRICDQQTLFEMTQGRIKSYEKMREALTKAPLLLMPDSNICFKLYIDSCGDGLGAAIQQVRLLMTNLQRDQFVTSQDKSNQQKPDMLQPRWFAYIHMFRWQIAIQEHRGNMTIPHKAGSIHKNADGISRWALDNTPDNSAYVILEEEPQIPIGGININDIGT